MPLSKKGRKIMKAMRKQYGTKRGEQVFYASKNKGTIEGVEESTMKKGRTQQTSQQKAMGESPAQFRQATAENIVDKRGKIKMTRAERKRKAKELLRGRSNQRSSIEDSFVYAYDVWSVMLAENQFASRPGGDGSGEKKGRTSERRAFINRQRKIKQGKREKMASTATIIKRLDAKKAMDDKIKAMFDKYKR